MTFLTADYPLGLACKRISNKNFVHGHVQRTNNAANSEHCPQLASLDGNTASRESLHSWRNALMKATDLRITKQAWLIQSAEWVSNKNAMYLLYIYPESSFNSKNFFKVLFFPPLMWFTFQVEIVGENRKHLFPRVVFIKAIPQMFIYIHRHNPGKRIFPSRSLQHAISMFNTFRKTLAVEINL